MDWYMLSCQFIQESLMWFFPTLPQLGRVYLNKVSHQWLCRYQQLRMLEIYQILAHCDLEKYMNKIRPITHKHFSCSLSLTHSQTQFLTASQGKNLDLCMFIYFSTGSLLWSLAFPEENQEFLSPQIQTLDHTIPRSSLLLIIIKESLGYILDLNSTTLLRDMCSSFSGILISFCLFLGTDFRVIFMFSSCS